MIKKEKPSYDLRSYAIELLSQYFFSALKSTTAGRCSAANYKQFSGRKDDLFFIRDLQHLLICSVINLEQFFCKAGIGVRNINMRISLTTQRE